MKLKPAEQIVFNIYKSQYNIDLNTSSMVVQKVVSFLKDNPFKKVLFIWDDFYKKYTLICDSCYGKHFNANCQCFNMDFSSQAIKLPASKEELLIVIEQLKNLGFTQDKTAFTRNFRLGLPFNEGLKSQAFVEVEEERNVTKNT